jgi:DNA-binding IclR family transcriptional regulator
MLSDEECKKILNRNDQTYTDDQIRNIKEFLWMLAQIEVKTIEINNSDEDSSTNEQSKF